VIFAPHKLTKRDYLMGAAATFAAIWILVALVYVIARIVNYFLPVGCVQ
jgi:hypothetical protein